MVQIRKNPKLSMGFSQGFFFLERYVYNYKNNDYYHQSFHLTNL